MEVKLLLLYICRHMQGPSKPFRGCAAKVTHTCAAFRSIWRHAPPHHLIQKILSNDMLSSEIISEGIFGPKNLVSSVSEQDFES